MKFAAIDLGTNTFHLVIAEKVKEKITIIYKINKPVKLGEDITLEDKIIPAAFARAINCLKAFKATLDDYKVSDLKAVATSGVRNASNGQDFIDAVFNETAISIEVIDGNQEAEFIYNAVKWSGAVRGKSLIMDIGGGSTEFIFCDELQYYWRKSFDIGAARLMQKFFKSDPISDTDFKAIRQHLEETLGELLSFAPQFNAENLIGSAGAFETYAEVINPSLDLSRISTAAIDFQKYQQLSKVLMKSTHQERTEIKNLIPLRVDMIVMATIITDYVIEKLSLKKIQLSTYDLKMGLLQYLAHKHPTT